MGQYLKIFLVIFGINLMPAFGPPTWLILVFYKLRSNVPVIPLVLLGAIAAALGRFLLAHAARYLHKYLPEKIQGNLLAVGSALERKKRHALIGILLFALSPVPSAQLFEAAGLARFRLGLLTAAFFAGRIVSYSIYVSTASEIQKSSVGEEFQHVFTNPIGIGIEILMLVLLVALARVDWKKRLARFGSV